MKIKKDINYFFDLVDILFGINFEKKEFIISEKRLPNNVRYS